jgi:hypothetical protein
MLLANNIRQHSISSASHRTLTKVVFWHQSVKEQVLPKNEKKGDNYLQYIYNCKQQKNSLQ